MGIVQEFKEFAMRGNVVDMAVGIIIGAEFGKIVNSLVNDIIMPPIGYLIGGLPFKELVFNLAVPAVVAPDGTQIREASNVAIAWGSFVQTSLNFLIVAFAIFMVIKLMNTVKKRFENEKKDDAEETSAEPSVDTKLLMEIRDALVHSNNGNNGGGLSPQRR